MSSFDTIIVGAGIAGISLAYELSKEQRVLVVEQESNLGYHSTGRSAAVYAASYKSGNVAIRALTRASWPMFKNPPTGFTECDLVRNRGLIYFADDPDLNGLAEFYHDLKATSSDVEWVNSSSVRERLPMLQERYVNDAIYDPHVYDLDVHEISESYRRAFLSSGGIVRTEFRVTQISRMPDRWMIGDGAETHEAKVLVNAAGAWGDEIARMGEVREIGIRSLRRSAILLNIDEFVRTDGFANWPMAVEFKESFYFKPDAGKLLVSPANEDLSPPCDVRPEDLDIAYAAQFAEMALKLTVKKIEHSWAGLRNFVSDRGLVIGFDPDAVGFFWLVGQGGTGVQTAPAAARLGASLILGKGVPVDLQQLGLRAEQVSPSRL